MFFCEFCDFVVIEASGVWIYRILNGVEEFTSNADFPAVCEVSAVRQCESHDSVSGFNESEERGEICDRSGVRLYVSVFSFEEFLRSLPGDGFDYVCYLLSFVISFSGVAFCVFVCKAA